MELVTVFEAREWVQFSLVKSALESAGIECYVLGEYLQGLGRASGPLAIQVRPVDSETAAALIADLLSERNLSGEPGDTEDA